MKSKPHTSTTVNGTETDCESDSCEDVFVRREYDRDGRPTGHWYLRCSACEVEVMTSYHGEFPHEPDCVVAPSHTAEVPR